MRTYQGLGEYYAGDPTCALEIFAELADASDDLLSRVMVGSLRGRALLLAGDVAAARVVARELDGQPLARRALASIERQIFVGELALADHDGARAEAVGNELARSARAQWLSAMPAIDTATTSGSASRPTTRA